jgi:hypothetical protein
MAIVPSGEDREEARRLLFALRQREREANWEELLEHQLAVGLADRTRTAAGMYWAASRELAAYEELAFANRADDLAEFALEAADDPLTIIEEIVENAGHRRVLVGVHLRLVLAEYGERWADRVVRMVAERGVAKGRQTPTANDVWGAIELSLSEIRDDVRMGTVPTSVATFSELHGYVDANEYGGLCQGADGPIDWCADSDWVEIGNEVQYAVDDWIRAGGLL